MEFVRHKTLADKKAGGGVIRLAALWFVGLAALVLFVILREEKLVRRGKVPSGRLRRLWFRSERRRAPRYRVDFQIRYRRLEGESLVQARTRDLSQTGVGLVLEEYLESGSLIDIEFFLPSSPEPVEVTGKVAWSREVPSDPKVPLSKRFFFAGVQFHRLDPEKEALLARVLKGKPKEKEPNGH